MNVACAGSGRFATGRTGSRAPRSVELVLALLPVTGHALAGPVAAATGVGTALVLAAVVVALPNLVIVVFMPSVRGIEREPRPAPAPA